MLNGLDLFSGIGGLSLALSPWVHPLAYCENDGYAQAVLLSRMWRRELPSAPIWDDVTTLVSELLPRSEIDIIYGGFPCQDISVAGAGAGLAGKRSGLVREVYRLVGEIRPSFVFLENVPAIRTRGADAVIGEMARLGYDARWDVVSAQSIGAPHLRRRWFMLAADSKRYGVRVEQGRIRWAEGAKIPSVSSDNGSQGSTSDARSVGSGARTRPNGVPWEQDHPFRKDWWTVEPRVGRVVHGLPYRVDRIRGLGNAVVPAQAREAFKKLMGVECG